MARTRKPLTAAQQTRQRHRTTNGRYTLVDPCYMCGKSGAEWSFNADTTDVLGNNWADLALWLCRDCYVKLLAMSPAEAWAWAKQHGAETDQKLASYYQNRTH
ncbi:MAG: hypothetical protein KGL39_39015 [Patescibacteria group bacterium]|nr:hypothetical protein [Patescibacteria group bacterium]